MLYMCACLDLLYKTCTCGIYTTVSARQLLFVWCSLSDGHQTIVRCLSDVPPDICQHPPDICQLQTSTTYTPDMYYTPNRHILYHMYTRCLPDIYQTSTRYVRCMVHVWCKCGTCLTDVWLELTGVWRGIWQASDNHLSII